MRRDELLKNIYDLTPAGSSSLKLWDEVQCNNAQNRSILLGSVLEIVREKQWTTELTVGTALSFVSIHIGTGMAYSGEAVEPCDAALEAYVRCLENL